jgi:hypothetical protein
MLRSESGEELDPWRLPGCGRANLVPFAPLQGSIPQRRLAISIAEDTLKRRTGKAILESRLVCSAGSRLECGSRKAGLLS